MVWWCTSWRITNCPSFRVAPLSARESVWCPPSKRDWGKSWAVRCDWAALKTIPQTQEVFNIFADVVRRPAFAPDRIEFLKNQYRGAIDRRNDNPGDIASREFRKLVYGEESPYARTYEYSTLNNFSRDDIIAFYQASVRPDQTILAISGDIDPEQMKRLIAETFGDWATDPTAPTLPAVPLADQAKAGMFMVDQPQLTQSYVQVGHIGGQRNAEDYPEMAVLNEVLNGFGGRLFNEVRSRQGLAYVVYAYWAARYDYDGIFIGGGQTRSDATVPFIARYRKEATGGLDDAQLRTLEERLGYLRALEERRAAIRTAIAEILSFASEKMWPTRPPLPSKLRLNSTLNPTNS